MKFATLNILLNKNVLANFYPRMELMDMEDFYDRTGEDWRVLNCWECFEARGKMCHDEDY